MVAQRPSGGFRAAAQGYHPSRPGASFRSCTRWSSTGSASTWSANSRSCLLKTADGNKFLPIWIGHPEAAAILMKLQGAATPRPMTHDLMADMLEQLDAEVTRITVTELRDNTFYASITVQQNGSEIEIDSRPSDAIAIAVRADAPIFAAEHVIEESAIEFEGEEVNEEEIVDEFRKFLDDVSPDQFAVGDDEN